MSQYQLKSRLKYNQQDVGQFTKRTYNIPDLSFIKEIECIQEDKKAVKTINKMQKTIKSIFDDNNFQEDQEEIYSKILVVSSNITNIIKSLSDKIIQLFNNNPLDQYSLSYNNLLQKFKEITLKYFKREIEFSSNKNNNNIQSTDPTPDQTSSQTSDCTDAEDRQSDIKQLRNHKKDFIDNDPNSNSSFETENINFNKISLNSANDRLKSQSQFNLNKINNIQNKYLTDDEMSNNSNSNSKELDNDNENLLKRKICCINEEDSNSVNLETLSSSEKNCKLRLKQLNSNNTSSKKDSIENSKEKQLNQLDSTNQTDMYDNEQLKDYNNMNEVNNLKKKQNIF